MDWIFADPECRTEGTCNCGFCKPVYAEGRACDYGDCHDQATTHCPRFGYPVCERHAHANCHNHTADEKCTTPRIDATAGRTG